MRKIIIATMAWLVVASSAVASVLSPEEAFNLSVQEGKEAYEVKLALGKGIYLYDHALAFGIVSPKEVALKPELALPEPVPYDEFLTYKESLHVSIPKALIAQHIKGNDFTLRVSWQGCSDRGLCYQPMSETFTFGEAPLSEHDAIATTLFKQSAVWVLLSFFGFGLLLAFTPCVFPMIPILSSIIAAQGGSAMGARRGFWLSFVYVLAMALAYTIAGVLAGLFGANIQTLFQTPWVIWLFSGIFVALALSMFGLYELQLPAALQQKLNKNSGKHQGVWGVAFMGFLSALIVGPCVAAPLAGALLYIGQSGDALLGGAALFVMSLGMGVPLLLIGASAGKLLPKPGRWMNATKAFFGITMLALSIWMLSRVIPDFVALLLYGALAVSTGVYMGALEPVEKGARGTWRLVKSVALLILVYGIMLIVGGVGKASDPLHPLAPFTGGGQSQIKNAVQFEYVRSVEELEMAVTQSTQPVMVDFYADWCVNCKELETITFQDPAVKRLLDGFTLLKVDVTRNTQEDKALLKKFNLFGPPGLIFYKDGQELEALQLVGFIEPRAFEAHLEKVLNKE